ncbi:uncharacterized protein LOC128632878 [Ictalurus punctatus]|uniref:Uncharacterized protein LOC128632878 n=1 Tax=Ictalurus punctatus TaxID=7998 RepID=A0A9F7R5C7_ICTPU|nr:uncharacterized protein LOC128632878 [Ictalurus punctatus]
MVKRFLVEISKLGAVEGERSSPGVLPLLIHPRSVVCWHQCDRDLGWIHPDAWSLHRETRSVEGLGVVHHVQFETFPAEVSVTPVATHHGPWVNQRRKVRAGPQARTSPPLVFEIPPSNRFAPLRQTRPYAVIVTLLFTLYMLPLGQIIRKHGISFHCYADDTQLYVSGKSEDSQQLSKVEDCVKDIRHWMLTYFLLFNSDKTEILVLGPRVARDKLSDHMVTLDGLSISSCTAVKDLGLIIDSSLSFDGHVDNITRIAFFHLRNISKIRNILSIHDAEILVHAFVTSRLDYCNALLSGCSSRNINIPQLVQNASARVLTRTRRYDHITPILSTLHWLPVKFRINYKILSLTFKALNGLAPQYLSDLLVFYDPPRLLRSKDAGYLTVPRIVKATAGGRAFPYRSPQLWNSLPISVRDSDTVSVFKSRLKTYLFTQAYPN